ncbi:hypothetical protein L917_12776, partial [Phytophthora nicotianae]
LIGSKERVCSAPLSLSGLRPVSVRYPAIFSKTPPLAFSPSHSAFIFTSAEESLCATMADSVFLDEVVGFLHNIDDPTVSGADLLLSLDKEEPLLSLPDTDIALQLLDVSPIDGLFTSLEDDHHSAATDSDCTSVETESVASVSSPRTTEVTVDNNIRSKDAIRRRSYRQKRKVEKAELYKEVEQLSNQLSELQSREEAIKARRGLGLAQTALWKALANRHLQARLMAEEQQRRLREAVERRSAVIKDLGVVIRKRISEEQHDVDRAYSPSKKPRIESPDMALYETFINELDEVYARTDSIFKEAGVQDSRNDDELYNDARAVSKKSNYHELTGKMTTPFPFDRVRAFVGEVKCMEQRANYERIQLPGVSDNTAVVKFRIQARVGNAVGSLVQHAITRRYYEEDRIVLIWRKFTEGEGVYAGMHSDETGWNIVRPSSDGSATVMESIIRYVPMSFNTVASPSGKLNEFTDTIISAGEEDCHACLQKLEALLLDDALGVC